jgi:MFS family permease
MQDSEKNGDNTNRKRSLLVLSILCIITMLNQADRVIMSVAGEAIKIDLNLSDGQIGILGGVAFSLLYSTMTVPIARLADRFDRWKLLSGCLLLWSTMTAICGAAHSFIQLLIARAGVGLGEAGSSPNTHSLIGDYFGAGKRTTAIAVLMAFVSIGGLLGAVVGGHIIEYYGWREAFFVMGIPGIILAPLCVMIFSDPFRGHGKSGPEIDKIPTLLEVIRTLLHEPFWRQMFIAATLVMIGSYSFAQFSAPFFIRRFALGYGDAGLMYGFVMAITGAIGSVLGGTICERLNKLGLARYGWIPGLGMLASAPLFIAGFMQESLWTAAAFIAPAAILKMLYLGPTFGLVQELVLPRMRATATALLFMVTGAIGGLGPVLTGYLIDHSAAGIFGSQILGNYHTLCPGGRALPSAADYIQRSCADALSTGTRDGLILTALIMIWAAAHYLYAAHLMRRRAATVSMAMP